MLGTVDSGGQHIRGYMNTLSLLFIVYALIPASVESAMTNQRTPEENKIKDLLLATLPGLEVRHALLLSPRVVDLTTYVRDLWLAGITSEVHTMPPPPTPITKEDLDLTTSPAQPHPSPHSPSSRQRTFITPNIGWNFLYGRDALYRRHIVVLLIGPAEWAVPAAVELMSRKVFGAWDTLVVVVTEGQVESQDLCPHVPLGVRVVVLQLRESPQEGSVPCEGLVSEAQLLEGGRYELRSVGCWAKGNLSLRRQLLPVLTSLKGATLRTFSVKGFNEIIPIQRDGKLELEGELGTFLMKVQKKLNFTLDLAQVDGFGTKTENGSFTGVVGTVERWEADFTSATLSVLSARAEVLDYAEFFGIHNTRFITKLPEVVNNQFLLFQIYTWKVWCTILGVLLLAATLVAVTWDDLGSGPRDSNVVATAMSTTIKIAVYAASVKLPQTTSSRILLTSTWLVMIILVSVYSGNLTAFLSIPRVSRPPETIRELIDRGYTLSLSKGFSQYANMKTSPVEDQQYIFKRAEIREDQGIIPDDNYIQQVKTEPVALMATVMGVASLMDKYAEKVGVMNVCTLKMGSETLFLETGAIGFPRNSPLKRLFDEMIVWIRETGLKRPYKHKCVKPTLQQEGEKPLGLLELGGVLGIWLFGMGMASLCFLVEVSRPWVVFGLGF